MIFNKIDKVKFKKIIIEFNNKYYLNNNLAIYSILNKLKFDIKSNIIILYFLSYTSMKFFKAIQEEFFTYLCKKLYNNNIKLILEIYKSDNEKIDINNSNINELIKENSNFLIMIKNLDLIPYNI